jgi:WhiB family transcriptional regulator, redox-sensing transcriptional regulator
VRHEHRAGTRPTAATPIGWVTAAAPEKSTGIDSTGSWVEEARTVAEPSLLHDDAAEEELSWQEHALCAQTDPEAFFPEKGGSTREAKKVCMVCDVRADCLAYALEHDERFGIWGGLSERERRRMKKRAV